MSVVTHVHSPLHAPLHSPPPWPQVEKEVAKASSLMEGVEGEIGRKKEVSRRVSGGRRVVWTGQVLFIQASDIGRKQEASRRVSSTGLRRCNAWGRDWMEHTGASRGSSSACLSLPPTLDHPASFCLAGSGCTLASSGSFQHTPAPRLHCCSPAGQGAEQRDCGGRARGAAAGGAAGEGQASWCGWSGVGWRSVAATRQ